MKYTDFPPQQIGGAIRAEWSRMMERAVREQRIRAANGQIMSRDSYGITIGEIKRTNEVELVEAHPFMVRWQYTNAARTSGEWQICLPRGCASIRQGNVTRAYVPVNDQGRDENGDAVYRWYAIPTPKDKDATVTTAGWYVAKQWTVHVLLKPWPRMKVTTDPTDSSFKAAAWDIPVADIATFEIAGDGFVQHGVSQIVREGGIVKEWDIGSAFAIRYDMQDEANPSSGVVASVINQYKVIGRMFRENEEPVVVNGWKSVWVKIEHEGTEFNLSVEKDLSGDAAVSDDDKTVFRIYDLEDDIVTNDARTQIPPTDFYTNAPEDDDGE